MNTDSAADDRRPVTRRAVVGSLGVAVGSAAGGATSGEAKARGGETESDASGQPFEPLDRLDVRGAKELVVDDDVAYVATGDGFVTVDASDPSSLSLLAERRNLLADHDDGPLAQIYDGKVGGDWYLLGGPANPTSNSPYAAVLYDVSDPADPRQRLVYETDFYHHNLDTDGALLFLCGNNGRDNPLVVVGPDGNELGRWSIFDADDRWESVDPRLRSLHDVWVHDEVAYCAYWNAGTWLIDVSEPTDPEPIGSIRGLDPTEQADGEIRPASRQLPGNDHFAMPNRENPDLVAVNEEAWAADPNGPVGGVELWTTDGERLSRIEAPPTDDATRSGTWTTAHNFDFVGDHLYTSWYRGGVRVHDVSDPESPKEVAAWRDSETTSFWTAQLGRQDEYVLASSWKDHSLDDETEGAAVYAFPDPAPTANGSTAEADTRRLGAAGVLTAGAIGVAGFLRRRFGGDDG